MALDVAPVAPDSGDPDRTMHIAVDLDALAFARATNTEADALYGWRGMANLDRATVEARIAAGDICPACLARWPLAIGGQ